MGPARLPRGRHAARTGYGWWIDRLRAAFELYDIIRLDHFRGFEAYWSVPAGETTAVNGRWVKGPGGDLFRAAQSKLGELPLDARIREQADGGRPSVVAEPDGPAAQAYVEAARKAAAVLARRARDRSTLFPKIVVEDS